MKIIINSCFGGFSLSDEAMELLLKEADKIKDKDLITHIEGDRITGGPAAFMGKKYYGYLTSYGNVRTDPRIVAVVEKLGRKADGKCAELKVIEIPDGIEHTIEEYDGMEHIAEKHETWR